MKAAAMLDPEGGRIIGWAAARGRRPGAVRILLDGREVLRRFATAPAELLGKAGFAALGPPPSAHSAFVARLPRDVAGRLLVVEAVGVGPVLARALDGERALSRYREGADMAEAIWLEDLRLVNGFFRARLIAGTDTPPAITLTVRGESVGQASLRPEGEGRFDLKARMPDAALSNGVGIVGFEAADGSTLARFPLAAGAALAGDLVAEVEALRVELDQLKKAFRGAMAGGVLTRDEKPIIVAEALSQVDVMLDLRDRAETRHLRGAEAAEWEDEPTEAWDFDE